MRRCAPCTDEKLINGARMREFAKFTKFWERGIFFAKMSNSIIITIYLVYINVQQKKAHKYTFLNQVQQFTSHTYY